MKNFKITECPVCQSDLNTRLDYDFPDTMACCDGCGADYIHEDGKILLEPREIE